MAQSGFEPASWRAASQRRAASRALSLPAAASRPLDSILEASPWSCDNPPPHFITRTPGPETGERSGAAGSPVSSPTALSTPGHPARVAFFRTAFPRCQALALHLYVRVPSVLLLIYRVFVLFFFL